jgi:hypothetical protein
MGRLRTRTSSPFRIELLDELVISSHHVPAIELQVLQGMKTLLFKGVKLLEAQLYLFVFGELVLGGHP